MAETDTTFLAEMMELFQDKFAPCKSIDQATAFLSTDEIHSAMLRVHPACGVQKKDVYDILKQSGYKLSVELNKFSFSLKWMLQER